MDNDSIKNAHADRRRFMELMAAKAPTTVTIEKGKHAGKIVTIVTVVVGANAVEYWGIVGNKKIATMLTNAPIGSLTQVTNAQVARDYWRSGIAHQIYTSILTDLNTIGATLEPHWNSMSPDAARFWKSLRTDDSVLQAKVDAVLADLERSGATNAHDTLKLNADELRGFWNGDTVSKKKLASLGIDTTTGTR